MTSKKRPSTKSKGNGSAPRHKAADNIKYVTSDTLAPDNAANGGRHPSPHRINPETEEDRRKRLAARKARTLRAFQITYENHHRRKVS